MSLISGMKQRFDGYLSVMESVAGLGQRRAARQANAPGILQHYAVDGLAAAIVDRAADDALAQGFTIDGDEPDDILNEWDRLGAWGAFNDATRWARLSGCSAILLLTADGRDLGLPLNAAAPGAVEAVVPYTADQVSPGPLRYNDPRRPDYGRPTTYLLTAPGGLSSFTVHESRLLRLTSDHGAAVNRQNSADILHWMGRSALAVCLDDLARYREGLRLCREILRRKQQAVYKQSGLTEMLAGGQDETVAKKLDLTDMVRDLFTTVSIDGDDEYLVLDASLAGIKDVVDEFKTALCASAGEPAAVLFGDDIKGLGSLGSGEQAIHHSRVRRVQERVVRPAAETFVALLWAQDALVGKRPERWRLDFNELWSPSEKEKAETKLIDAQALKAKADSLAVLNAQNALLPEEQRSFIGREMPEFGVDPDSAPPEPLDDPADDALPAAA